LLGRFYQSNEDRIAVEMATSTLVSRSNLPSIRVHSFASGFDGSADLVQVLWRDAPNDANQASSGFTRFSGLAQGSEEITYSYLIGSTQLDKFVQYFPLQGGYAHVCTCLSSRGTYSF